MLLLSAIMSSCDPSYETRIYIENGTGRNITFKAYSPDEEFRKAWFSGDEVVIAPHTRIALDTLFLMDWCDPSDGTYCMKHHSDSILINFGDCMLTFHSDCISAEPHSPYADESFHLENLERGWAWQEADAVYVVTEEDYQRAK